MPAISRCWSRPGRIADRKNHGHRRRKSNSWCRTPSRKQDLEEVVSNTGLYFGDAARFAPNTGNHTAFVLVNLVTGHEGKTDDYIAALRQKLRQASARRRSGLSNRRHHQRRVELRSARADRHSSQRPEARPHSAGRRRDPADEVAQVPNTTDVRIKQGKSYPELHVERGSNQSRLLRHQRRIA